MMILAPTNRRVIRPGDKPSFEHTQRYGLIRGHWANTNRVGLWPFNEGSGTFVNDLSGNGKVGTFTGTALPTWLTGLFGSTIRLTQSDNGINTLLTTTSDMTIITWITPISNGATTRIWGADGSGNRELIVWATKYNLYGAGFDIAPALPLPTAGRTDCVACVISETDDYAQLYINGILAGEDLDIGVSNKTVLQIGATAAGNAYNCDQHMTYAYNRLLSASEIALLYREPFLGIQREPRITYFFVPTGEGEDYVRTINDSVGLTDVESLIKEIYRTFDESMGVTDVDSKIWNSIRIVAESLGITDILTKEEAKVISESLGLTDAISRVSVILRTLAESLGIIDSVSDVWTAIRTFAESLGITDEIDAILENLQVIDDSIGLTDTTSRIHVVLRTLSESLGLTDAITSVFVINRIISDSEGITDGLALQRIMTVADTLGITDDVTRLIDYLRMEDDAIGLLDSMVRVSLALRTIDDDMGITDEVSAQLGALLKAVWAFVVMRQTHS